MKVKTLSGRGAPLILVKVNIVTCYVVYLSSLVSEHEQYLTFFLNTSILKAPISYMHNL